MVGLPWLASAQTRAWASLSRLLWLRLTTLSGRTWLKTGLSFIVGVALRVLEAGAAAIEASQANAETKRPQEAHRLPDAEMHNQSLGLRSNLET